jgi:pimeloyl-ACP methyl ester carboxylesterase
MNNLSPGTHSFLANGIRLVYHVAGSGPVMITHSGGPGSEYSYLCDPRLEERYTMVYLEPVGTGKSGPLPEGSTYVDTYAELLRELIDHLGVPQVHLMGHSHGGFVAQRYAIWYPGRVAGLALYSSSPSTRPDFWQAEQAAAARYPQRHPGVPEAAAAYAALVRLGSVTTDAEKTAVFQAALPVYFADFWGRRAEFEDFQAGLRSRRASFDGGNGFDFRPELSSITARTVVVAGRHDFICGPVWAEMLHQGIAGSRLVILENSGHFGQIEEPDAFLEAVTWLRD